MLECLANLQAALSEINRTLRWDGQSCFGLSGRKDKDVNLVWKCV